MTKGPKLPDKKFDPLSTTLAEAQAYLKVRAVNGTICPCCAQEVKVLEKEIHPYMARTLIILYRHCEKNPATAWTHVASLVETTALAFSIILKPGEWSKLRYWGLIEERPKTEKVSKEEAKKGYYRLTPKGLAFVKGEQKVPRAILFYDDRHLGFSADKEVGVRDVLGKDLVYEELMDGKYGEGPVF